MPTTIRTRWTARQPNYFYAVDRDGASARFWCRGIEIQAGITVRDFAEPQGTVLEAGLVQILTYSKMAARYGNTVCEWYQNHLPAFDSTDAACIPWYTPNLDSHVTIAGNMIQNNLTLFDLPTFTVLPRFQGKDLTRINKHNKFDVYFLVRRKTGQGAQAPVRSTYQKHLAWETHLTMEPIQPAWANAPFDPASYRELLNFQTISYLDVPRAPAVLAWPRGNYHANGDQGYRQPPHP